MDVGWWGLGAGLVVVSKGGTVLRTVPFLVDTGSLVICVMQLPGGKLSCTRVVVADFVDALMTTPVLWVLKRLVSVARILVRNVAFASLLLLRVSLTCTYLLRY